MGTTIHFEGHLNDKTSLEKILIITKDFSESMGWKLDNLVELNRTGVIIQPHEKCESIDLIFDKKLRVSGFIKTEFAPIEVHLNIVKLLHEIRPLFKKLNVNDESWIYNDYEEFGEQIFEKIINETNNAIEKVKQFDFSNIIVGEINDSTPEEVDKWFWIDDPFEVKLDFPTVRDKMRFELSEGRKSLLSVPELMKMAKKDRISITYELEENRPEPPFMILAEIWALRKTQSKTKNKESKCVSFAWAITELCLGQHGGYLDNTHRKVCRTFEEMGGDRLSPEETLEALKTILEMYKLTPMV